MRSNRPSRTAQYVGLVRTLLTDKGILDDAHAAAMLTPTMRVAAAVLGRMPQRTDTAFYAALAARTAVFDDAVRAAVADGITQIVVIAAGYDSRAWRLAQPGVTFYEVDHPATQADKRRRAPRGGPVFVPCDLTVRAVGDALVPSGFDAARPALFVVEGLTMYLSVHAVANLLRQTAALAAAGSRLVVNFSAPKGTGPAAERGRNALLALLGRFHRETFGSARNLTDPAALVASNGWPTVTATSLYDEAQRFAGSSLDIARVSRAAFVVAAERAGASPT